MPISFKRTIMFISLILAFSFSAEAGGKRDKLFDVIENGSQKEVKNLIRENKDCVNITRGTQKENLLMAALKEDRDTDVIKILLRYGADPTRKDKSKRNAVSYAAQYSSHPDALEAVIKHNAPFGFMRKHRILKTDKNGKTAFDYAKENSSTGSMTAVLSSFTENPADIAAKKETEEQTEVSEQQPEQENSEVPEQQTDTENTEQTDSTAQTEAGNSEQPQSTEESPVEPEPQPENPSENSTTAEEQTSHDEQINNETAAPEQLISEENPVSADSQLTAIPVESITDAVKVETVTGGSITLPPPAVIPSKPIEISGIPVEVVTNFEKQETQPEQEEKPEEPEPPAPVHFTSTSQPVPEVNPYKKTYLFDYAEMENDEDEVPPESNYDPYHTFIENADAQDLNGRTKLMLAAKNGNLKLVEDLIFSGANLNLTDNDGWTALMFAARFSKEPKIIQTLINNGAKTDIKNNYGITALKLAAGFSKNEEIVEELLSRKSLSESDVRNSFIYAVTSGSPAAVLNVFYKKGLPVNAAYDGKTPLMYAAESNKDTKTIAWLLANGAKTTYRTRSGLTAFDFAKQNKNIPHDKNYWALKESGAN